MDKVTETLPKPILGWPAKDSFEGGAELKERALQVENVEYVSYAFKKLFVEIVLARLHGSKESVPRTVRGDEATYLRNFLQDATVSSEVKGTMRNIPLH
jgi:hypothetical protein